MTSPAGRGQLGDARRAARFAGRRIGQPEGSAAPGGQQQWFDADPPTEPLPAVPAQPPVNPPDRSTMSWTPPRLVENPAAGARSRSADELVGPPDVRTVLRTVREMWRPNPPYARRPPLAVRLAYRYWLISLALGLAARIVMIVAAWHYRRGHPTSLADGPTVGGTIFELLVLVVGHFVIVRMRHGDEWARTVLAMAGGLVAFLVALTALGNISMLTTAPALFRTATALLRLGGCAAAGFGIWYMFQPGAAEHYDPRRRDD